MGHGLYSQFWIRHHPSVVDNVATGIGEGPGVVWTLQLDIAFSSDLCLFPEWLWEALATLPILHAGCVLVEITTGTMNHEPGHQSIQSRLLYRIRNLSRDDSINLLSSFEVVLQEDQEMDVR